MTTINAATHTTVTLHIEDDGEIGHQWVGPMGAEVTMAALHELHFPIAMGRITGGGRAYQIGLQSLLRDGSGPLLSTSTNWTDDVAAEMFSILDGAFGRHEVILPGDLIDEMGDIADDVLKETEEQA